MAVVELLKPIAGTWRVVVSRWLLFMLAVVPGMLALNSHLDRTVGIRPWFHDLEPPLSYLSTRFLLADLGDGVSLLLFGALAIWLLQLVWLGGAARVLDPRTPGVYRKVFANGWQYLGRFVRIAGLAILATAILQFIVSRVFAALSAHAEINAWSIYDSFFTLNMWRVAIMFVLLTSIGVIAFWARIIAVHEDRTDTRRLPWQVLRLLKQKPLTAFALQFLLVCAVLVIQAVALWCWRQSASGSLWLGFWALLQLLTAYVWQFRIRAALNTI